MCRNHTLCVLKVASHCHPSPATDALQRSLILSTMGSITTNAAPSSSALHKKTGDGASAFDLRELAAATRPVEASIAFPTIEWNNDDEGGESSSDATVILQSSASLDSDSDSVSSSQSLGKRSRSDGSLEKCRLVRSKAHHTCLSSLENLTTPSEGMTCSDALRNWNKFVSEGDCGFAVFNVGGTLNSPRRRFRRLSATLSVSVRY